MIEKIKVLHTEWSDGWGGQEIRIINEMIAIRERGVKVFLACREHSVIKQRALENNFEVFTLPFKGNTDLRTLKNIVKIINDRDIDIVNTHSGKDTWVGGLAAKYTNIKFIRTRHLSTPIKSSRINFINQLADYIFTTGESIRLDMIKNNRINPQKIKSIPTGIDINLFNPKRYDRKECRDNLKLYDNQCVIGSLGVLRQFKRHDRFLLMAKHVIKNNPNLRLHFLLAGDGPQQIKINKLINEMGLNDCVTMLGHVDNVAEFLKTLDIFVLTSDSGEGVPQSLMQALLMQIPVVSTNAGSTKDLYNDENFILVDKDSQDDINKFCNSLVKSIELRKKYLRSSTRYIAENFSINTMTEKILKEYISLFE